MTQTDKNISFLFAEKMASMAYWKKHPKSRIESFIKPQL